MNFRWYLVVLASLILVACQPTPNDSVRTPNEVGTIVAIEDGKMLVVDHVSEEDLQTLTPIEIVQKRENGAWFSYKDLDEFKVGMEVRVWYDAMNDSLPGSGNATEVEILGD